MRSQGEPPPCQRSRPVKVSRDQFDAFERGAEIGRTLFIGETTVKTHVTRILTKLRLRDRAHAVVYGYETGLVRPGEPPPP